jgi:GxxExxY protein
LWFKNKKKLAHFPVVQLEIVMDIEEVARHIVDSAVQIHTALGPGLLESAYCRCLMHELGLRGLKARTEYPMPIRYKGVTLDCGYRADLLVDGRILIESKTVDAIHPIHQAQLLTYLKLSGCLIGFLINWKVVRIKDGIQRMIWNKR